MGWVAINLVAATWDGLEAAAGRGSVLVTGTASAVTSSIPVLFSGDGLGCTGNALDCVAIPEGESATGALSDGVITGGGVTKTGAGEPEAVSTLCASSGVEESASAAATAVMPWRSWGCLYLMRNQPGNSRNGSVAYGGTRVSRGKPNDLREFAGFST